MLLEPMKVDARELVTVTGAARIIGISTQAVGDAVYRGRVRTHTTRCGLKLLDMTTVEQWKDGGLRSVPKPRR